MTSKKQPDLVDLTAAWANAKNRFDDAERELALLREQILAAGGTVGYKDAFLEIGSQAEVLGQKRVTIVQSEQLERALAGERVTPKAQETFVVLSKVQALAEIHPKIAKALEAITSRATPRFLRAKA